MASPSKEVRRAYYQRNREKILERQKATYLKKKDILLEYQREYRKENRALVTQRSRKKRVERMKQAISLLGGKCANCGGVFDSCQYDFHHINPEEKDFTISEGILLGKARFFEEVKKCILLCANCHRLKHKEVYS